MDAFFATSALIVSLISLLITIWLWRESNRPIVTARIKTHKGGNVAILYNLEVVNSGTRPAKNVRLSIDEKELSSTFTCTARRQSRFEHDLRLVKRCFEDRAMIPVLLNGEILSNAFGQTSVDDPFWSPGAILELYISYQGLQGQAYRSKVPIRIDDTAGFAGSFYEPAADA